MKQIRLEFYECEHSGDLDNYLNDVQECGGKVIDSDINHEAEIGYVTIEVISPSAFWDAFEQTDAYGFLN